MMMPNRKISLEGRGPLTLTDSDYLSSGGEGIIYRKANTVVKIYSDPSKMAGMRDKVKKLSAFDFEFIAAPQGMVLDTKGADIGFYMPFVSGAALSLIFTNDFRNREGVTAKDSSTLAEGMRNTVTFAHFHNALLVDPNELNWLVILKGKSGIEPRIIDVDSWVLDGKIPASVPKMPSIRDWHSKNVSKESDWFAYAVVSFQVYTGIHPYKGTAPNYKPSELERRMKDNVSVFSKGVRLNHAVRDFSVIPAKLLEWFIGVFQDKDRSIPPSPFDIVKMSPAIQVLRTVTTATGRIKYERLLPKVRNAIRVFPCGVVLTADLDLIDLSDKKLGVLPSADGEVLKMDGGWLKATDTFSFVDSDFSEQPLSYFLEGNKIVAANDRLFFVNERGLTELVIHHFRERILSVSHTWGALYNSTKWFDGVGVMDALGSMWLIAPFSPSSCAQVRVKELDGIKVLNAKAGHRFVTVMGLDAGGTYRKFEFYFDAVYSTYKVWTGTAASPDLNIAILPKGVCATIIDDGELVIFVPSSGVVNRVSDKKINTNMLLARWDSTVLYIENGEVWKVSL